MAPGTGSFTLATARTPTGWLSRWGGALSLAGAALLGGCGGEANSADGDDPTAREPEAVIAQALINTSGTFGVYAPDSYQDGWLSVWSLNDTATGFADRMSYFAGKTFKWGLRGSLPYIQNDLDEYAVDAVDVMWLGTHGGLSSDGRAAVWAMWDRDSHAFSTSMSPGDEARQTKLFISYACSTMDNGDGRVWERWGNIMRAGVKIAAAYTDLIYIAEGSDDIGWDFAANLNAQWTVDDAWDDAANLWWHPETPAVMVSGRTSADCWDRLANKTYNDLLSSSTMPRLNPWEQGTWCKRSF